MGHRKTGSGKPLKSGLRGLFVRKTFYRDGRWLYAKSRLMIKGDNIESDTIAMTE